MGNLQGLARWRSWPTRATATTPTSTRSREARKVLVEQIGGTLVTIAKDVKIQVEFNPAEVARLPADRLREPHARGTRTSTTTPRTPARSAPGHTVTALYEIVPAGRRGRACRASTRSSTSSPPQPTDAAGSGELLTLKLRYKQPDGDTSTLLELPGARTTAGAFESSASADFQFAAARGRVRHAAPRLAATRATPPSSWPAPWPRPAAGRTRAGGGGSW